MQGEACTEMLNIRMKTSEAASLCQWRTRRPQQRRRTAAWPARKQGPPVLACLH